MIFPFFMRTVVSSGQLLTRARSHWPAAVVGRGGSNSTSDSGFYRRQYFPGTPKEVEPNRGNLRDNQSGVCEPGEFRSRSTSAVWPTANGRRLVFFFSAARLRTWLGGRSLCHFHSFRVAFSAGEQRSNRPYARLPPESNFSAISSSVFSMVKMSTCRKDGVSRLLRRGQDRSRFKWIHLCQIASKLWVAV